MAPINVKTQGRGMCLYMTLTLLSFYMCEYLNRQQNTYHAVDSFFHVNIATRVFV